MNQSIFLLKLLLTTIGEILVLTEQSSANGCPLDTPNQRSYIDDKFIDYVAYRGDSLKQYYTSLRDLNNAMNEDYHRMIDKIGRNIYPLIIASDIESGFVGVGTTYTLFLEDGSTYRIAPTGPQYEMYKSLAHIPIGLFAILSPYFKSLSQSSGWQNGLKMYQEKIDIALNVLQSVEISNTTATMTLTDSEKLHGQSMLTLVQKFISNCLEKKSATLEAFLEFGNEFFPHVKESIKIAAKLQVFAALPALQKWKNQLGPKWRDAYVVIPTVWAVSERNTRQQIFEQLLDEDKISTNIIIAEGAKTIDEARTVLGRILGDRSLAEIVFGRNTKEREQLANSLSTRKDLIAKACDNAINQYLGRSNLNNDCK